MFHTLMPGVWYYFYTSSFSSTTSVYTASIPQKGNGLKVEVWKIASLKTGRVKVTKNVLG